MSEGEKLAPEQQAAGLIRRIAEEITFHPENLVVEATPVGRGFTITVQAHASDTGRLVGPKGNHIKAMDCIVAVIGNKHGITMRTNLIEPVVGKKDERHPRFVAREDWNSSNVMQLLSDVCDAVFLRPSKLSNKDTANATTAIEVEVSQDEKMSIVKAIGPALQILWNAIGKANGRMLVLDVVTEGAESGRELEGFWS